MQTSLNQMNSCNGGTKLSGWFFCSKFGGTPDQESEDMIRELKCKTSPQSLAEDYFFQARPGTKSIFVSKCDHKWGVVLAWPFHKNAAFPTPLSYESCESMWRRRMLLLGSVRFDTGTSSLSRRTKTPFVLPQQLAKSVFVTGTNQSRNLLPCMLDFESF